MPIRFLLALILAVGLCAAGPAAARIVSVEIESSVPFAGERDFGAGPYLRITGRARGELDPADPRNGVIVDLDRAPRNAAGRVEYMTPFVILRPADPARASGRLVHEITNRGRKLLFSYLYDAVQPQTALNALDDAAAVGLGLPLAAGHVLAWNGWDPAAPRGNATLVLDAPVLAGVTGLVREEFVFGTRINPPDRPTAPLAFTVADPDQARATLTVRRRRADPPQEIPRSRWAYAGPRAIRALLEGTLFEPGSIYELRYPARDPHVFGVGYAATRDIVSFLRHESAGGPLAGIAIRTVLAVGISQSGRYLRHHLDLGMNADEAGRRVFDGMLVHIAGIGRVFANERFAQPDRTATWHEDRDFPENAFPFAYAETSDPITGRVGRLLRGDATDPLVIEVNTSTEYWQKGASLVHTDPAGTRDLPEPPGVRMYLVAGTKHGGRAGLSTNPGRCANPNNPHSSGPLLRALLTPGRRGTRRPRRAACRASPRAPPCPPPRCSKRFRPFPASVAPPSPTRSHRSRIGLPRGAASRTNGGYWSRPWTRTAMNAPASACPISPSRAAPIPAGTCTPARGLRASCATGRAASCPSPRTPPRAMRAIRAAPWLSVMRLARPMSLRCARRRRRWSASGCCWRPMSPCMRRRPSGRPGSTRAIPVRMGPPEPSSRPENFDSRAENRPAEGLSLRWGRTRLSTFGAWAAAPAVATGTVRPGKPLRPNPSAPSVQDGGLSRGLRGGKAARHSLHP